MASVSGANIAQDGLVFSIDRSNSKSWRGKSTTNITRYNASFHPNNKPHSGLPHSNGNEISNDIAPPIPGMPVYKVIDDAFDTQNARYSFRFDMDAALMNYDTTYVWSIYVFRPAEYASRWLNTSGRNATQNSTGTDWHTARGYNSQYNYYSAGTILVDEGENGRSSDTIGQWERWWISFRPTTANINIPENSGNDNNKWIAGYLRANIANGKSQDNNPTPYHLYLAGGQLEVGTEPSPWVEAQRLTNQVLTDTTQSHNVVLQNWDYTSDGLLTFDGTDAMIRTQDVGTTVNSAGNDFTVQFWIKPTANVYSRFITPFSHGIDQWIGYDNTWGRIEVMVCQGADQTAKTIRSNTNSVLQNQWTNVAVSIVGQIVYIWINGNLQTQETVTNFNIANWVGEWFIGQRGNNTYGLVGSLDLIKVYKGKLTNSEVRRNYISHRGRFS